MEAFERGMKELGKGLERAAREVEAAEKGGKRKRGVNVNVARRRNVLIVGNVGEPGTTTVASVKQHAPIRQKPGKHGA